MNNEELIKELDEHDALIDLLKLNSIRIRKAMTTAITSLTHAQILKNRTDLSAEESAKQRALFYKEDESLNKTITTFVKLFVMEIFTINEIKNHLKVSDDTIRRAINKGDLHAFKLGSSWRISSEQLEAYLKLKTFSVARKNKTSIKFI